MRNCRGRRGRCTGRPRGLRRAPGASAGAFAAPPMRNDARLPVDPTEPNIEPRRLPLSVRLCVVMVFGGRSRAASTPLATPTTPRDSSTSTVRVTICLRVSKGSASCPSRRRRRTSSGRSSDSHSTHRVCVWEGKRRGRGRGGVGGRDGTRGPDPKRARRFGIGAAGDGTRVGARAARTLRSGETSPSDSAYPSYPTVREKVSAFFPMPKNDDMVACPAGALFWRRRFCTRRLLGSPPSLPPLGPASLHAEDVRSQSRALRERRVRRMRSPAPAVCPPPRRG